MYLDTADIKRIEKFTKFKWVTGVTTNPTILNKIPQKSRETKINDILTVIDDRKLFVQLSGDNSYDLVKDANTLIKKFGNNISLKIPVDLPGLETIETIKEKYPETDILGTVIFSVEQAYLAGEAGCDWIAPYFNRMENQSINASEIIKKTSSLYNEHSINTKILGASFKNSAQVMNALLAGAYDVTVPPEILANMMDNKLASDSIITFNKDSDEVGNR